ncbi:MAG: hypothetical protein K2Q23_12170 [Bryobacteraceae bacterium]|nr:hypothetical protein [Bryobacteraceae bacterium]
MFETIEQHEAQDFGKPNLKERLMKVGLVLGIMAVVITALIVGAPS